MIGGGAARPPNTIPGNPGVARPPNTIPFGVFARSSSSAKNSYHMFAPIRPSAPMQLAPGQYIGQYIPVSQEQWFGSVQYLGFWMECDDQTHPKGTRPHIPCTVPKPPRVRHQQINQTAGTESFSPQFNATSQRAHHSMNNSLQNKYWGAIMGGTAGVPGWKPGRGMPVPGLSSFVVAVSDDHPRSAYVGHWHSAPRCDKHGLRGRGVVRAGAPAVGRRRGRIQSTNEQS